MKDTRLVHAMGLHMHQPPDNLRRLLDQEEETAAQILCAYDRVQQYAHRYAQFGKLHVCLSGSLLEQLLDPAVVDLCRRWVDVPEMLEGYRSAPNIELIGTGFYHPLFPLIPPDDWPEQIIRGRQIVEQVFGRAPLGFWPPHDAFTMALLPVLQAAGYAYVLAGDVRATGMVQPCRGSGQSQDRIALVPFDRTLSRLLESGTDLQSFGAAALRSLPVSPGATHPLLITTWCDGENAPWFRDSDAQASFFGRIFRPYVDAIARGDSELRLVLISEYLHQYPAADVAPCPAKGDDDPRYFPELDRWVKTTGQQRAMQVVEQVSERYWSLRRRRLQARDAEQALARARRLILQAEASCFLGENDDLVPMLYERTGPAVTYLNEAEAAAESLVKSKL